MNRKLTIPTIIFAMALTLLGTSSAVALKVAPSTKFAIVSWIAPVAGTEITRPDGVVVTLPKDWSSMSISDLATIGIHPNMGPDRTTSTFQARNKIQPYSSNGCSGWVCINIIGSGLLISGWSTKADYSGPYMCTYSAYWNSLTTVLDTGTVVCGSYGTFYGTLSYPVVYKSFGWACNTWVNIVGKPCEQIIG